MDVHIDERNLVKVIEAYNREDSRSISNRGAVLGVLGLLGFEAEPDYPLGPDEAIDAITHGVGDNRVGVTRNGDLIVGEWRVHLVWPGEGYGTLERVLYEVEQADRYGDGLPLVEFYGISDGDGEPCYCGGRFVTRYYASTLLDFDGVRVPPIRGMDDGQRAHVVDWLERRCAEAYPEWRGRNRENNAW